MSAEARSQSASDNSLLLCRTRPVLRRLLHSAVSRGFAAVTHRVIGAAKDTPPGNLSAIEHVAAADFRKNSDGTWTSGPDTKAPTFFPTTPLTLVGLALEG